MSEKEIVIAFFIEGYVKKNYEYVLKILSEDYINHSPASARSNHDAVNILKIIANIFDNLKIEILDVFAENEQVATRVRYEAKHIGEYMGISATHKTISFEVLENFKVVNGKIVESWGYWPDKEIEVLLLEEQI